MENKPNNNEISELLARLQKQVEEKPEPVVDSVKPIGGESPQELLDLLKKNIGAKGGVDDAFDNHEYSIEGFEFEEEETEPEEELIEESQAEASVLAEAVHEDETHTAEEEEILRGRVELLVTESVTADEEWELPQMAEKEPIEDVEEIEAVQVADGGVEEGEKAVIVEASVQEALTDEEVVNEEAPNAEESLPQSAAISYENQDTVITEAFFASTEDERIDETDEEDDVELVDNPIVQDGQTEGELFLWENSEQPEQENENETEDEYADIYLSEPGVKRFFRFRRLKAEAEENKHELLDAPDFDNVDINLALALGSKEALESSVGYARVRSARNGFYDPFLEEPTGDRAYGYCGEEFRDDKQTETIKGRYAAEQSKLNKRFLSTFLLSIFILFFEHLPMTEIRIPYLSDWLEMPLFYYGMAVLLSILLIVFSFKKIVSGLRATLFLQGEPFVPVSCLALLNLIYNVSVLIFFSDRGMPVYNFAVAIFLLFGVADDAMRLTRERLAFDVVSDKKPKLSLEMLEGKIQAEASSGFSFKQDFFVEKVNFVGNFFTRSGRRSVQFSEYFHELAFSALASLIISLLSIYLTDDVSTAFTAFVFSMLICVPMQFLTANIYPFFHLTKGLSRLGSAVIGDAVTEEYNDADTIYLEDSEMFGKHGARVVGVRVYNDMDFYAILSYALSVFTVVGAPLCNVFDNAAHEIEKKENVKITNISVGGVEAVVDLKTVHVGNLAFMRSHGYFPKRNPDDEQKIESGQVCILYMAIGGELCAKIYLQYTVTQRFEKFAAEMLKNGVRVGIRTLDPNINEKMIATLRNDREVSIKVIRPTPNELIPIGKHSDSGIVTSKNSHMVFKILEQCFNIKRIHQKQRQLRLIAFLLGALISALLMIGNLYARIPSLYIAIYQLVWLVPSLIYTKSKLK
ncbi:MAG: hypothetical protein IJW69_02015 [Clostridia bacterium]|nr:hypothetical protein [Clostridia bacterium]